LINNFTATSEYCCYKHHSTFGN